MPQLTLFQLGHVSGEAKSFEDTAGSTPHFRILRQFPVLSSFYISEMGSAELTTHQTMDKFAKRNQERQQSGVGLAPAG